MSSVLAFVVLAGLATTLHPGLSGVAAAQRNSRADDWCRDDNWGRDSQSDNDRRGVCEVREYTVPAAGATMTVDAAPNGGIDIGGSARGDILVHARVVATAGTEEEARAIAARVQVVATADRVSAEGPRNLGRREGWHVSYRLDVPTHTPLSLRTTNGGITIDNVNSRVEFRTVNGGVKLARMARARSKAARPTAASTWISKATPGRAPGSTWRRPTAACTFPSRRSIPRTSKRERPTDRSRLIFR